MTGYVTRNWWPDGTSCDDCSLFGEGWYYELRWFNGFLCLNCVLTRLTDSDPGLTTVSTITVDCDSCDDTVDYRQPNFDAEPAEDAIFGVKTRTRTLCWECTVDALLNGNRLY